MSETMPKKSSIYLLRHGEIDSQGQKVLIGQMEVPLSARGKEQALWWKNQWASISFARVYCSDLVRSQQTAKLIVRDKADFLEILPQLREINLGRWEGLSADDVELSFPGEWRKRGSNIDEYRPADGESFLDLRTRALPLFKEIVAQAETPVLIVGHAGVNRVILCDLLGMPLKNLFRLGQDYGALNIIDSTGADLRLRIMNMCPDL